MYVTAAHVKLQIQFLGTVGYICMRGMGLYWHYMLIIYAYVAYQCTKNVHRFQLLENDLTFMLPNHFTFFPHVLLLRCSGYHPGYCMALIVVSGHIVYKWSPVRCAGDGINRSALWACSRIKCCIRTAIYFCMDKQQAKSKKEKSLECSCLSSIQI